MALPPHLIWDAKLGPGQGSLEVLPTLGWESPGLCHGFTSVPGSLLGPSTVPPSLEIPWEGGPPSFSEPPCHSLLTTCLPACCFLPIRALSGQHRHCCCHWAPCCSPHCLLEQQLRGLWDQETPRASSQYCSMVRGSGASSPPAGAGKGLQGLSGGHGGAAPRGSPRASPRSLWGPRHST